MKIDLRKNELPKEKRREMITTFKEIFVLGGGGEMAGREKIWLVPDCLAELIPCLQSGTKWYNYGGTKCLPVMIIF